MQLELVTKGDGTQAITVYFELGPVKTAQSDHPHFKAIKRRAFELDAIQEGNGVPGRSLTSDEIQSLLDLFHIDHGYNIHIQRLSDRYTYSNGILYKDGDPMPENDLWATQVKRLVEEGRLEWGPLIRFAEKLDANPNEHSREQFYGWLQHHPFTITEEGDVVAYKGVKRRSSGDDLEDYPYESLRSGPDTIVDDELQPAGRIKQGIGSVVEYPRSKVHFDPKKACSNGLHVGSYDYACSFGTTRLRVVINPRDVVNVPNDDMKVRVCRYLVLEEAADGEYKEAILVRQHNVTDGGIGSQLAEVELVPGEKPHEIVRNVTEESQRLSEDEVRDLDQFGEVQDDWYCFGCEYRHDGNCEDPQDAPDPEPTVEKAPRGRRNRYPSPAKWDDTVRTAKRRKKGVKGLVALANSNGWTLIVENNDPYERKSWRILSKEEREVME